MAGGSLTISVSSYPQLQQVAQSVLCWVAPVNRFGVRTTSTVPFMSIQVPEELFGAGSLVLRRNGTDLVAGYVAGSHVTYNVSNANVAVGQDANTCPARTNQPTINSMTTNVGGNPLAVTLNYANFAGAGTVNVFWGDGTSTLGAAESNAALAHTYPNAGNIAYTVTVTDASDATQSATANFVV
jgi:hypothetical protein